MVNSENINILADFIEEFHKMELNMAAIPHFNEDEGPKCGSAGCIGGFATVLWPEVRKIDAGEVIGWSESILANKLGLEIRELLNLCYNIPGPGPSNMLCSEIDRPCAVRCLRELAETGEINFRVREHE